MLRLALATFAVVSLAALAMGARRMPDLCPCCQAADSSETSSAPHAPPGSQPANTSTDALPACDVDCTLSPAAEADRVAWFEARLRPHVREIRELDDGYALRFDSDPDRLRDLADWIAGESRCCAFLDYQLTVHRAGGPLWFQMTGAPAAKDFLRPFLAANVEGTGVETTPPPVDSTR